MRRLLAILGLLTLLIAPTTTRGATIHVPTDEPTIQAGIYAATDGDVVLVAPGTYQETISFIGKRIAVRSEQGPDVTVIDAAGDATAVLCCNGESSETILEGFTVRGAENEAISCGEGVAPRFIGLRITENSHHAATIASASATFEDIEFIGNGTWGIWAYAANVTVTDCLFNCNGSSALRAYGGSDMDIIGSEFSGLGQEYSQSSPVATIEGSSVRFSECLVADFTSPVVPIAVQEASAEFANCTLRDNHGTSNYHAGVLSAGAAEIAIIECSFYDNSSQGDGGACFFNDCTVHVSGSNFAGNVVSGGRAGAIGIGGAATLTLDGCTFDSNSSHLSGGAVYCDGPGVELDILDCVFVGNTSLDGVLYVLDCDGSVSKCTFYDCSVAPTSGIVVLNGYGNVSLDSCVVSSCEGVGVCASAFSAFTSISHCDVHGCSGGSYGDVLPDMTGYLYNISEDPMFCDPLGGDLRLDAASPCVGAGLNGCDIGALGVGCGAAPVTSTSWGAIKAMYM